MSHYTPFSLIIQEESYFFILLIKWMAYFPTLLRSACGMRFVVLGMVNKIYFFPLKRLGNSSGSQ